MTEFQFSNICKTQQLQYFSCHPTMATNWAIFYGPLYRLANSVLQLANRPSSQLSETPKSPPAPPQTTMNARMRVRVFMLSCGFRFHSKLLLLLFYGVEEGVPVPVPAAVSVLWLRTVLKLNTVSRFPKLLLLRTKSSCWQMVLWLRFFDKIRQQ